MANKEKIMRNTHLLNRLLHKKDIAETERSQFAALCLLYIKEKRKEKEWGEKRPWAEKDSSEIVEDIRKTVECLMPDSSDLLKDPELSTEEWHEVLGSIDDDVYRHINPETGQDLLSLFFTTFNKFTGKSDRNQAFTPDHIAEFMCAVTGVGEDSRVLDECCGSGSFLVQACNKGAKSAYGIECEEKAHTLARINMLLHDDQVNIRLGSCFEEKDFIREAAPSAILINPPYNAKPRNIPDRYKEGWTEKEIKGLSDPTKGLVFIKYLSDIAKEEGWKDVKLAVLLPTSTAIGTTSRIANTKAELLKDNTLEAVFSLPKEIFYPGAAVQTCCMVFTLNKPHQGKTFFGYYKEDGFKKKRNAGRVEQFDEEGNSLWKKAEEEWLTLYRERKEKPGLSAIHEVTGEDEWLCEAYMETDYTTLTEEDFQKTINEYLSFLIREGKA